MDYPTVLVRWRDASSYPNTLIDEAVDLALAQVETVGFLVKYDMEHLVILNGMVEGDHAQDSTVIPTCTVDEVLPLGLGTWHGEGEILPDVSGTPNPMGECNPSPCQCESYQSYGGFQDPA